MAVVYSPASERVTEVLRWCGWAVVSIDVGPIVREYQAEVGNSSGTANSTSLLDWLRNSQVRSACPPATRLSWARSFPVMLLIQNVRNYGSKC